MQNKSAAIIYANMPCEARGRLTISNQVSPPSCPQVVRQSVRLSITTKALLGRDLAVAWLLSMENQYK